MAIKVLVMDVDGTLTDGGIYICEDGNTFKKFDVKDGYAIRNILPGYNIMPIILTGKKSKIVEVRAAELGITNIIQGSKDKVSDLSLLAKQMDISFDEVAYIGDDLNDYDVMLKAGLKGCPADAVAEIAEICDYVCKKNGGNGAVREFIDYIITNQIFSKSISL